MQLRVSGERGKGPEAGPSLRSPQESLPGAGSAPPALPSLAVTPSQRREAQHRGAPLTPRTPPSAPTELKPSLPSNDRADKRRGEASGLLRKRPQRGSLSGRLLSGPEQCWRLSRREIPVLSTALPPLTLEIRGSRWGRKACQRHRHLCWGLWAGPRAGSPSPRASGGGGARVPRKLPGWEPGFVVWNEFLRATRAWACKATSRCTPDMGEDIYPRRDFWKNE